MAKFKKAILEAGRVYHSPDGKLEVTPERLAHWAAKHRQFKDAGIAVPVSWGHDDDPSKSLPVKFGKGEKRRLPQNTVGYLDSFELTPDGQAAEITLDIRRKADAELVRENLAYVSPVVFSHWADGDGVEHEDCITHCDLVQHPVDHHQSEFSEVVACSLRMGLDTGKPALYRLQDEPSEEMEEETNEDAVQPDGDRLSRVIEELRRVDIILSDDTNETNLLAHLEQALLTMAAMKGDDMSDEQVAVNTPDFAALSLDQGRYRKHADKQHQSVVKSRLDSLLSSGRCTPAEHKEKSSVIGTVRLSLDDDGNHQESAIETWVASRETIPAGTFYPVEQQLRMAVVEHPEVVTGEEVTPERANEIVEELFGS